MSENTEKTTRKSPVAESIADATDTIKNIIENLVPPDEILIVDVWGEEHKLPATCSARSQIKIMRIFEDLKDITLPENLAIDAEALSIKDFVGLLGKLITNDYVFESVCRCAQLAHPKLIAELKAKAESQNMDIDEATPAGDLFPIEEVITMIVPLFLRIARRGAQAIQKMTEVA